MEVNAVGFCRSRSHLKLEFQNTFSGRTAQGVDLRYMRLVMMGTGNFAVPIFELLYKTHHQVVALVTAPLRFRGRKTPIITPMREAASEYGTPIFDPQDINTPESREKLRGLQADLFVVCDFGQILSAETLATSRLGGVNLHSSLLPKYRGAAPIPWALYHGEEYTGTSVIHMTPEVDAGPLIAQSPPLRIKPDETAEELEQRLAKNGAWFVRRAIDSLESGRLQALPQDPRKASKAPKLKKSHGLVDWNRSAREIFNHYRAMQPWPKTFTFWHRRDQKPLRLIIGPVRVETEDADRTPDLLPGTVLEAEGDRLIVVCGKGTLRIDNIQPSGKKRMEIAPFLRGYPMKPGERLAPEILPEQSIPESEEAKETSPIPTDAVRTG
jgi:methionyl-tRNA formyltransferase